MDNQKILIIQNVTREKPALIGQIFRQKGIAFDVVDLDAGDQLPLSMAGYKALIVLGGPDSANDDTEKMQQEIAFVREAIAQDMPYFGVCLGLQVGVKAAGGTVRKSDVKEIGFFGPNEDEYAVVLTEKGRHSPLFAGLEGPFQVFQLHGETVELGPGMQLLGTGKYCRNQIVQIAGKAYGTQCHFQLDENVLQACAVADPDLESFSPKELQQIFQSIKQQYDQVAHRLFSNFLNIAGL